LAYKGSERKKMRLALMAGDIVPAAELNSLGFEAVQMFFGGGTTGDDKDPSPADVDAVLAAGNTALAAMTLHVDLVGSEGRVDADVERAVRCVAKTAALDGRFGANVGPLLVWHPSGYPEGPDTDDRAVFEGLCSAVATLCQAAEDHGVRIGVEITRAGSVGSAETFLHLKDRVPSKALGVCLDAANFVPDRTPLQRAVRALAPHTFIAHGKDSRFSDNGEVADYGPTGSGRLDYPAYISALKSYADVPYFVLEYYRSRQDLLAARDIVRAGLDA
jgi:sugar phosphate isomerase/epimerase